MDLKIDKNSKECVLVALLVSVLLKTSVRYMIGRIYSIDFSIDEIDGGEEINILKEILDGKTVEPKIIYVNSFDYMFNYLDVDGRDMINMCIY